MLTPPPNDPAKFKESYLYCWAAGLASHLNVTRLGIVGYTDIVAANGGYMNEDGTIPEDAIAPIFSSYNVYTTSIPCSNFSYDYILHILQTKGHMIIMYNYGEDMGHTQVVYGIGVPDDASISIFDPMTSASDYQNIPISQVSGSGTNMYVGWPAWAGP
jgi:hypothetical protein